MTKDDVTRTVSEVETLLNRRDFVGAQAAIRRLADERYRSGYKHAVENYAVWRDGQQFVGVLGRPLPTVLDEVDKAQIPIVY